MPAVRAARPDEAEQVLQILCAAFDLDADAARPVFHADPYYDLAHKRVLSLPPAGVVSCLTVVPMHLRVRGIPVLAGGVAGVATLPPYRRRGYAAALLKATVPDLWAELGCPLSLLHPLAAPFYRQFGWEYATRTLDWAALVPSLLYSLPPSADTALVRPACEGDWPAIAALHDEQTRADTGACVRDPRRWRLIRLPVPGREAFVCEEAGELTGYGLWERRGEALHLLEMQGRTEAARRGLLGHAARRPEASLHWRTTPAQLGRFGLPPPVSPSVPDAMLRIVDLPAALAAVHAALYAPALAGGASLTLFATDTLRPLNTRPIRLAESGLSRGTRRDRAWLRADIRILAQLYLGYQTPSDAAASGLVSCDSPRTLALADALFPARMPFVAPLDQV